MVRLRGKLNLKFKFKFKGKKIITLREKYNLISNLLTQSTVISAKKPSPECCLLDLKIA